MTPKPTFFVQPYEHRQDKLVRGELVRCDEEVEAWRRGRAMRDRVAGMVFYKIETSELGDQWVEIEVLAAVGELPPEAA